MATPPETIPTQQPFNIGDIVYLRGDPRNEFTVHSVCTDPDTPNAHPEIEIVWVTDHEEIRRTWLDARVLAHSNSNNANQIDPRT